MSGGRMLDHKDGRRRVFAADREPLDQAQQHQERRRREPDLPISRHQPDQECRDRHHDNRDDQRPLSPKLVADMTKDQTVQRTHQKPGGKDTKRRSKRWRWRAIS
jgi:hypothetical protein